MRKWTPEQQQAIDARGASFLVSAAAGSGKTSVLVARLIAQLSDPVHPIPAEKMAIVTFTNDAAAEMKQRLHAALSAAITAEPENAWLRRQHSMLQCARISTIHSFCFDLIRDNCAAFDITPTFRILEPTEEHLLRGEILSEMLEQCYTESESAAELDTLCAALCGQLDTELETLLLSMYESVTSMPFGIARIQSLLFSYHDGSFFALFFSNLAERVSVCIEMAVQAARLAEAVDQPKLSQLLAAELEAFTLLHRALCDSTCTAAEKVQMIRQLSFGRLPNMAADCPDPDARGQVKAIRDAYKKVIDTLRKDELSLFSYAEDDLAAHIALLPMLFKLMVRFSKALFTAKCEKNAIGFSDAEELALSLLAVCDESGCITKTQLAQELSDYYEILMIDEFQDTNNKQELIFKLLSRNGTAQQQGENMFVVGDVKQCIYRFRLANPQNFIHALHAAVPYSSNSTGNAFIQLNRNFRSSTEVVSLVNLIFQRLMSERVGEVTYDDNEKLVQGAAFARGDRATEIALVTTQKSETENFIATYTAKRINELLRSGAPVSINGGTATRPCTPRDFCILMRYKKKSTDYIKALAAYGIPAYAEEASAYLSSREIALLLNILRVVDNPPLDTAMLAVLLSPMFSLNMDDITTLRLLAPTNSLYAAICISLGVNSPEENVAPVLTGNLLQKVQYVYKTISDFRMHAVSDSLETLIRRIYENTDFLAVMQRYQDGAQKTANLRMLLLHARNYETNTGGGVSGFLRYIAQLTACGKDVAEGATISGSDDVVSIKTIHASKGLEFPFLFLVETEHQFSKLDSQGPYQFHPDYGFGLRLQNPAAFTRFVSFPYAILNKINNADMISEEMRLLYVALTRAKERIFLPLYFNEKIQASLQRLASHMEMNGEITVSMVQGSHSMSTWIWMALLSCPSATQLFRLADIAADCAYGNAAIPLQFVTYQPEEASTETTQLEVRIPDAAADPTLVALLQNRFATGYSSRLTEISAKTSVSALAKDDEMLNLALKRPRFLEAESKLTGAERGTALHAYLQYADFDAASIDADAERRRLVAAGYLTQKQADSIHLKQLHTFFDSPLYQRIRNAKQVFREKKFLVRLCDLHLPETLAATYHDADAMLSGIIDLFFVEENGLVLVDYKTDAVSTSSLLTERYSQQLELYRQTLTLLYPLLPVKETILYAFYQGKAIPMFT